MHILEPPGFWRLQYQSLHHMPTVTEVTHASALRLGRCMPGYARSERQRQRMGVHLILRCIAGNPARAQSAASALHGRPSKFWAGAKVPSMTHLHYLARMQMVCALPLVSSVTGLPC